MSKGILFLGAPGCGKGTQAQRVAELLNFKIISTGDMLREHVKAETEFGVKARSFLNEGKLVPDDVLLPLFKEIFSEHRTEKGYILDGFPRNLSQAKALTAMLEELKKELSFVIYLDVSEEEIVRRLTRRRVCESCGAIYHLDNSPPVEEGICSSCGSELLHRGDDHEDVIRNRLKVYREHTEPLVSYYRERGILRHIIGLGTTDAIFNQIAVIVGDN